MQTRKLGYSDLYLTSVGLGTWAIGGGHAEIMVGQAIAGRREEDLSLVLRRYCGSPQAGTGMGTSKNFAARSGRES